jgi:hypothetical protein
VKFGAINCDNEQQLCGQFGIKGTLLVAARARLPMTSATRVRRLSDIESGALGQKEGQID